MARRRRDLSVAQVAEVQALGHARTCTDPSGCPLPVVEDGAWAPDEDPVLCSLHRQRARNARGVCPNCASAMANRPIVNQLTGKPRTQAGVPQTERACTSCGYVQRERKARRRARV